MIQVTMDANLISMHSESYKFTIQEARGLRLVTEWALAHHCLAGWSVQATTG